MTVRELIDELGQYDPDLKVCVETVFIFGQPWRGEIRVIDQDGDALVLANDDPLYDDAQEALDALERDIRG